jgi:hypothetical protein
MSAVFLIADGFRGRIRGRAASSLGIQVVLLSSAALLGSDTSLAA